MRPGDKVVESWLALVQHGDDPEATETELVTVEFVGGQPRVIESTDGTRIELLQAAGDAA